MTNVSGRISVATIALSVLFVVSSISVPTVLASANASFAAPTATPLTVLQANWAYPNGNQFNWNYNPQNLINSSNAQYLGLSWLFPLPTHPTALLSVSGGLGVDTAPLIINGTVYAVTQYGQVWRFHSLRMGRLLHASRCCAGRNPSRKRHSRAGTKLWSTRRQRFVPSQGCAE